MLPPLAGRAADPLRPYPCGDGGIYIHTIRGDGESVTEMLDESVVFAVGERRAMWRRLSPSHMWRI